MSDDPLILTATFDPAAASLFQALRDCHFPPRLNIVPAHLTLFHHLPGSEQTAITAHLQDVCIAMAPMPFTVSGLRFLGRGVAFALHVPALAIMHQGLADRWRPWLTRQDAQSFRPHVTVQNKADPAVARALHDQLAAALPAIAGTVTGVGLWHYRGGPWDKAGDFTFGSA